MQQRGLTLVELMLSLVIGMVLSLGVCQLYLGSTVSALQDAQLARLQESARYALRYLDRELTMAGYLGSAVPGRPVAAPVRGSPCFNHLVDPVRALEHFDDVDGDGQPSHQWVPLPEDCLAGRGYVAGSDMLLVRRSADRAAVAAGERRSPVAAQALYLRLDEASGQAGIVPGGGVVDAATWLFEYTPQLLFLRAYSTDPQDGIPTLCRLRLSSRGGRLAPVECLVEGVEDLQIEFGVDEDGDDRADRYVAGLAREQVRRAVSARVFLLLRTLQPLPGHRSTASHSLGSKEVPATGDGFYRRVVQATVLLRNTVAVRA